MKEQKNKALKMANILKALSNPLRLLIVCYLLEEERYAQDITDHLGTSKGNISQHLTLLLSARIISRTSIKNRTLYKIQDVKIKKLIKTIKDLYCPDFKIY
jgi:ArsR family transcriptional regulator